MLACLDLLRNRVPPPTAPATLQPLGPEGSLSSCCHAAHPGLIGQNSLLILEAEQQHEIILRKFAIRAQCFDPRTDKPLRHWIFLDCSFLANYNIQENQAKSNPHTTSYPVNGICRQSFADTLLQCGVLQSSPRHNCRGRISHPTCGMGTHRVACVPGRRKRNQRDGPFSRRNCGGPRL